ncbi:MAG: PASTA domain-containing protein [Bryobacteraceae bacterium]
MISLPAGTLTDQLRAADGSALPVPAAGPAPMTLSGLDLIGRLLAGAREHRGLAIWAVGSGDPSWDQALPAASVETRGLLHETWRQPLRASDIAWDPASATLTVTTTLNASAPAGTFREWAIFGGDASCLANSGLLFSYRNHPALAYPANSTLLRQWKFSLKGLAAIDSGLDAVAALLSSARGTTSVRFWAMGSGDPAWDAHPPAPDPSVQALHAEVIRKPLRPLVDISYDARTFTVVAHAELAYDEANALLRESALVGGRDGGQLIEYRIHAAIDHTAPVHLTREFRYRLSSDQDATVPDVSKLGVDDATKKLRDANLTLAGITEVIDAANAGKVAGSTPSAGTKLPLGSRVGLQLAIAPRTAVPNCLYLSTDDARTALQAAGLIPNTVSLISRELQPGVVRAQDPAPGAQVAQGSKVTLTVTARPTVAVPDLKGLPPTQAQALLAKYELILGDSPGTEPSDELAGTIIHQSPEAGADIAIGSTVGVVVAAVRTLAVPDLTGLIPDDARAQLAKAGADLLKQIGREGGPPALSLGAQTEVASPGQLGTIISQDPAPGTQAALYASVAVSVAASPSVPVPDLVGLDAAAANTALTAAGLQTGKTRPTVSSAKANTVIAQSPPAGTIVARSSAVDVSVAQAFTVAVPSVLTLDAAVAREAIRARGLVPGEPATETSTAPKGTVTKQNPAPGTLVVPGTTIALTVAGTVQVPKVTDLLLADAQKALSAVGLTFQIQSQTLSDRPVGTVLSQNPAPGGQLPLGGSLALVTAQGVAVPSILGLQFSAADNTLKALKLVLVKGKAVASDKDEGIVLDQSPGAGAVVPLNTQVTVSVADHITVPDLKGASQDKATATLAVLGLKLALAAGSIQDPDSIVDTQQPAANARVALGATVTVHLMLPNAVTVPDLIGASLVAARTALDRLGLTITVAAQALSDFPPGQIFSQEPTDGTIVKKGSAVRVGVSKGVRRPPPGGGGRPIEVERIPTRPFIPAMIATPANFERLKFTPVTGPQSVPVVSVPDLAGADRQSAAAALAAAGLALKVSDTFPSTLAPDLVLTQDPNAGASARNGSSVSVTLSRAAR